MANRNNKISQNNKTKSPNRYISRISQPPSKGQKPIYGVWDTQMNVFIKGTYTYVDEAAIECADRFNKSGYSEQ